MILTNCIRPEKVDCACNPYFDDYDNNLIGRLDVGNLVSATCTFSAYVIDWYLDGELVLTTGKGTDPDIDEYHPFINDAALIIEDAGIYVPVIRYVVIDGDKILSEPKPCQKWCEDLSGLPSITVRRLECSVSCGGPTPTLGYDCKVVYESLLGVETERDKTLKLYLGDNTGYVAFIFTGYIVKDTVSVYYNDETEYLESYVVGTNVYPGNDPTLDPMEVDASSVKFLVNITDRTFVEGDYLRIVVTASTTTDTKWGLEFACLDRGSLDIGCASCFPIESRDVDLATFTPTMTYNGTTCTYTLEFKMDEPTSDCVASDLYEYSGMTATYGGGLSSYEPIDGTVKINLIDAHYFSFQAKTTNNYTCKPYKRYSYIYDPDAIIEGDSKKRVTFIFYDSRDLVDWQNSYNSAIADWKMTWSPDKTSWQYYKLFYMQWRQNPIDYNEDGSEKIYCDDTFTWVPNIMFHRNTEVAFETGKVDLIFTASDPTVGFTHPVSTYGSGDMYGASVAKRIAGQTIEGVLQPQISTITLSGTNGTLSISGAGGLTKTVTFTTDIYTTAQNFVTVNAADYLAQGIVLTCTTSLDYVATMTMDLYTELRNDFDANFVHPADETSRCNNVWSLINSHVTSITNTLSYSKFSGNSSCKNCATVNGYYVYEIDTAQLSVTPYYFYYLPMKALLGGVCTTMLGWFECIPQEGSPDNACLYTGWKHRYTFFILDMKVEFTNLEYETDLPEKTPAEIIQHRLDNFRISSRLNRTTGELEETYTVIYETSS